eukprot:367040_1
MVKCRVQDLCGFRLEMSIECGTHYQKMEDGDSLPHRRLSHASSQASIQSVSSLLSQDYIPPQTQPTGCWKCLNSVYSTVWGGLSLTKRTLIGCIFGVCLGLLLNPLDLTDDQTSIVGYIGELYIRFLELLVIPFVSLCMMTAPSNSTNDSVSKDIGIRILMYYCLTTSLAICEGLIWSNIFRPGQNANLGPPVTPPDSSDTPSLTQTFLNIGRSMLDNNLFGAFVRQNILGVIVFSLWLGFVLMRHQRRSQTVGTMLSMMRDLKDALMSMVEVVIEFTPIAVMSLVAGQLTSQEVSVQLLQSLGWYIANLVTALSFHLFVTYPTLLVVIGHESPLKIMGNLSDPLMTAFSTSSSAASIPANIRTAIYKNGADEEVAAFVVPLGATINSDGASIKYPTAVMFLAALNGQSMSLSQQVVIGVVSAFVAMGASPIPNAGVVFLVLVLNAVSIPVTGYIVSILAIEWLSDRIETTVNVTGDAVGTVIIDRLLKRMRTKAVDDRDLIEGESERAELLNAPEDGERSLSKQK